MPSARLQAVLERLRRDPSKIEEIATQLQREDPALFTELIEFIQSRQGG
jgi:hypothetical protein